MKTDIENATQMSLVLRGINNLLMRATMQQGRKTGIDNYTIMHGWVLGYLCDHKDEDVYQRDIEREFSITRSAVTSVVKSMETNSYIKRVEVEHDARLKKLIITNEGEAMHNKIVDSFKAIDKIMIKNIDDEDYKVFLKVCRQIKDNLGGLL